MQDSSLGIIAALEATGEVTLAVNSTFPGWGLTTLHTWPSWVSQNLAQYHPQIAIGSWSWDDPEALSDPVAYRALLTSFVRAMLAPADGVDVVVLLQFPQAGPDTSITDPVVRQQTWVKQTRQQDAWNAIARQVVTAFPGHALYLTTEQLFAPDGRFLTWMRTPQGKWVRARKLDNTHMCPYGAARVRRAPHRRPHALPPSAGHEAGLGVRVVDPRSPLQRPSRCVSRRPATARLPGRRGAPHVTAPAGARSGRRPAPRRPCSPARRAPPAPCP